MIFEYIKMVGVEETIFRVQHPERLYYHHIDINNKCRFCKLKIEDLKYQKVCQTLINIDQNYIVQDSSKLDYNPQKFFNCICGICDECKL